MMTTELPGSEEMYRAVLARDSAFEGVFFVAVRTTGIFCRPTCPARKPLARNVEFFGSARDALFAGYRPCKRCHPLEPIGAAPAWLADLLEEVECDPTRRWRDADLRERGIEPLRVRRWFQAQHGMTFHAYARARRLGRAFERIRAGGDLNHAAYDSGFESPSGFRDAFGQAFGTPPGRARGKRLVLAARLLTPLGPMIAAAAEEGVCLLEFADRRMLETQLATLRRRLDCLIAPGHHAHLERLEAELEAYFAGELRHFEVPLLHPGTAFQCAVWEQLGTIPYGETRSYAEIAAAIGRPGAQRAVGRANGDNRLAILLPCHRVVRADGQLSGYGGGLWRKRWLLDHERG